MNLDLQQESIADKPELAALMQKYLQELSNFYTSKPNDNGEYTYEYLDTYWSESERYPFLFKNEAETIGFCLVNDKTLLHPGNNIAEFYILPEFRHQGIGELAAKKVLAVLPGYWEIHYQVKNSAAQKFWRKVAQYYTGSQEVHVPENNGNEEIISFNVVQ